MELLACKEIAAVLIVQSDQKQESLVQYFLWCLSVQKSTQKFHE